MKMIEEWFGALTFGSVCARLLLVTVLAGLIGNERGRHGRAAGMRTHIFVCLGAALTMIVGQYTWQDVTNGTDPLRLGAQAVSGIGFLGVGTILIKDRFQVTGLTTAAGLWATASVGLAIGIGYACAGIATALLVLVVNLFLPHFEKQFKVHANGHLYIELSDPTDACFLSKQLDTVYGLESFQITPPRSGMQGGIGIEMELVPKRKEVLCEICSTLMKRESVRFAIPFQ